MTFSFVLMMGNAKGLMFSETRPWCLWGFLSLLEGYAGSELGHRRVASLLLFLGVFIFFGGAFSPFPVRLPTAVLPLRSGLFARLGYRQLQSAGQLQ